jgi:hypothetical protein
MLGSVKTGNRSLAAFSNVPPFSRVGLGGSGTPIFDANFAQ